MAISLKIDGRQLDLVAAALDATEVEVSRALRSTLSRMATWLKTRASKSVRTETGLDFKVLRKRFRAIKFKRTRSGGIAGVWVGLNPIDLGMLDPVQGPKGVAAGPRGRNRAYDHAFMGPRPGKLADKLKGGAFKREGKKRLPIHRLGYDIQEESENALESDAMDYDKFEEQFYIVFERELKWRTSTRK